MTRNRWVAVAAVFAALCVAAGAFAVGVTVDSRSASATWLGLTQPAVTVAPGLSVPGRVTALPADIVPYALWWDKVPNATAYRIWLDGTPTNVVPADNSALSRIGRTITVGCGQRHRWNVQGLNARSVGPISSQPMYWDSTPCP